MTRSRAIFRPETESRIVNALSVALREWTFEPGHINGEPVAFVQLQDMVFDIGH